MSATETAGPPPTTGTVVPRPDTRQPWERQSEALVRKIRAETDELARYLLRLELLRVRYTPWRQRPAQKRSQAAAD